MPDTKSELTVADLLTQLAEAGNRLESDARLERLDPWLEKFYDAVRSLTALEKRQRSLAHRRATGPVLANTVSAEIEQLRSGIDAQIERQGRRIETLFATEFERTDLRSRDPVGDTGTSLRGAWKAEVLRLGPAARNLDPASQRALRAIVLRFYWENLRRLSIDWNTERLRRAALRCRRGRFAKAGEALFRLQPENQVSERRIDRVLDSLARSEDRLDRANEGLFIRSREALQHERVVAGCNHWFLEAIEVSADAATRLEEVRRWIADSPERFIERVNAFRGNVRARIERGLGVLRGEVDAIQAQTMAKLPRDVRVPGSIEELKFELQKGRDSRKAITPSARQPHAAGLLKLQLQCVSELEQLFARYLTEVAAAKTADGFARVEQARTQLTTAQRNLEQMVVTQRSISQGKYGAALASIRQVTPQQFEQQQQPWQGRDRRRRSGAQEGGAGSGSNAELLTRLTEAGELLQSRPQLGYSRDWLEKLHAAVSRLNEQQPVSPQSTPDSVGVCRLISDEIERRGGRIERLFAQAFGQAGSNSVNRLRSLAVGQKDWRTRLQRVVPASGSLDYYSRLALKVYTQELLYKNLLGLRVDGNTQSLFNAMGYCEKGRFAEVRRSLLQVQPVAELRPERQPPEKPGGQIKPRPTPESRGNQTRMWHALANGERKRERLIQAGASLGRETDFEAFNNWFRLANEILGNNAVGLQETRRSVLAAGHLTSTALGKAVEWRGSVDAEIRRGIGIAEEKVRAEYTQARLQLRGDFPQTDRITLESLSRMLSSGDTGVSAVRRMHAAYILELQRRSVSDLRLLLTQYERDSAGVRTGGDPTRIEQARVELTAAQQNGNRLADAQRSVAQGNYGAAHAAIQEVTPVQLRQQQQPPQRQAGRDPQIVELHRAMVDRISRMGSRSPPSANGRLNELWPELVQGRKAIGAGSADITDRKLSEVARPGEMEEEASANLRPQAEAPGKSLKKSDERRTPNAEASTRRYTRPPGVDTNSTWSRIVSSPTLQFSNMAFGAALAIKDDSRHLNSSDPKIRKEARTSLDKAVGMVTMPAATLVAKKLFRPASELAVAALAGKVIHAGIGASFISDMQRDVASVREQYQDALTAQKKGIEEKAVPADLAKLQQRVDLAAFQTSVSGVMLTLAGFASPLSHSRRTQVIAGTLDLGVMLAAGLSAGLSESRQAQLGSYLHRFAERSGSLDRQFSDWLNARPTTHTVVRGTVNLAGSSLELLGMGSVALSEGLWYAGKWGARKTLSTETCDSIYSKATGWSDHVGNSATRFRDYAEDFLFGPGTVPAPNKKTEGEPREAKPRLSVAV